MRIPISGGNGEAIVAQGSDIRHILEDVDGTSPDLDGNKFVFIMKLLIVHNSGGADGVLELFDSDEDDGGSPTGQIQPEIDVPAGEQIATQFGSFDDLVGPRFRVNVTAAITGGTVAVNAVFCSGYLVG